MTNEQLKQVLRTNDDDLAETCGADAVERACTAVDALTADANRWRGLRLVLAEKDEAAQTRMFEAVDTFMESRPDLQQENVTPDALDRLIDELLVIAGGARDANS